jgi:integrin alpha FG-GAP repeat containing protein 1
VVPGDFDGDAFMDVMFTVQLDHEKVGIFINYGQSDHMNCTSDTKPIIVTYKEPLAFDYNSDMVIDLFGLDENKRRTMWVFKKGSRDPPEAIAFSNETHSSGELDHIYSHSFLDLNDDSLADLCIRTDDGFEVWRADYSAPNHFLFDRKINFPISKGREDFTKYVYGQEIWIDLELNGNLNQVVPVCKDPQCEESIIWVHSEEHYHALDVNFMQKNSNDTKWGFIVPRGGDFKENFHARTITLRAGDFNNDGYPGTVFVSSILIFIFDHYVPPY